MPDDQNKLYLHEAIELRAELDARITLLKTLLPESRENRDRWSVRLDDEVRFQPVATFDPAGARAELGSLTTRKRKLNQAIQRVNFDAQVSVDGEEMTLAEALELRKALNVEIGELATQLRKSAYERVVYKEERDIVEKPERDYLEVKDALEKSRLRFRELNRKLRDRSHETVVEFRDEA